jgi:spore germination protein GerM
MLTNRYVLFTGLALFIGVTALFIVLHYQKDVPRPEKIDQRDELTGVKLINKSTVHLFFADRDNQFLVSEKIALAHENERDDLAKKIIGALIRGPQHELARTIPPGTTLRALYITAEGVCYVDLSNDVKEKHPGGVQSELLTIYSIVNSLTLNVSGVEAVKILIGGEEATTLAGHVDLQSPVQANMLLIR